MDGCDAVFGIERYGAPPEVGCGEAFLVVQGLGVGQPGVVVEGTLQVGVAHCAGALAAAFGGRFRGREPTSLRRWDAPELFDVDVYEGARRVGFESQDRAQLLTGGRVQVGQVVDARANQDSVHSRGSDDGPVFAFEGGCDASWPLLGGTPDLLDELLDLSVRAGGPV
ncbi:hypothetical protein [Mycobacterium intracellulare]|uniref:hypothetical protein n=1 Tax=Mycobacterium intracellulare TaxID=1767 RepID=UPI001FF9778B|nr:hypothetical protein [Mycobacterium intracellulare]